LIQPKIIHLPSKKVVGFSTEFVSILDSSTNNFQAISPLWSRFLERCPEIINRVSGTYLGVCDPLGTTDKSFYSYMACVEVEDFNHIPGGMVKENIPAGRYVIFTHYGRMSELKNTLTYIYRAWLLQSNEKQRPGPGAYIESYDERFKENSANSAFDIYVAIE
jgi:AraC family transcriptional regulator